MNEQPGDSSLSLFTKALALHQSGKADVAIPLYRARLASAPDHLSCLQLLGAALYQTGRAEAGARAIARVAAILPGTAQLHSNLSLALLACAAYGQALRHAVTAVVLDPLASDYRVNLVLALQEARRFEEAESWAHRTLAAEPGLVAALSALGATLRRAGRHKEAGRVLVQAIVLAPDDGTAWHNYGVVLNELGDPSAHIHLERSVLIEPANHKFLRNFAEGHSFMADDPWLLHLIALAPRIPSLEPLQQLDLDFAVAKALDDVGRKAESFTYLLRANSGKRRFVSYDEAATLTLFERTRERFTSGFLSSMESGGPSTTRPIFIVGLPRSGTTLIEQILASHPRVYGAGELDAFPKSFNAWPLAEHYPDWATAPAASQLAGLGMDYLRRTAELGAGAEYVIDKLPGNLLYAGLIRLALPGARIILVRRDPVDVCLSCFAKQFSDNVAFAYDLGELGRYAAASMRLMDHWERVLPTSALLSVRYEDVVEDLPGQAARLLEFCSLPWDDAVLSFHRTRRAVRTASVNQVRQPLYKSSVGKWRPGPELLEPLLSALGTS